MPTYRSSWAVVVAAGHIMRLRCGHSQSCLQPGPRIPSFASLPSPSYPTPCLCFVPAFTPSSVGRSLEFRTCSLSVHVRCAFLVSLYLSVSLSLPHFLPSSLSRSSPASPSVGICCSPSLPRTYYICAIATVVPNTHIFTFLTTLLLHCIVSTGSLAQVSGL